MARVLLICFLMAIVSGFVLAQPTTITTRPAQTSCVRETDHESPRRTTLQSDLPTDEMIHLDVDGDRDPDMLETWWNEFRVRWIDENDDMTPGDRRGDLAMDALQIDRDGDGYYDGPGDLNIKWVDDDGDGRADAQLFAANPTADQTRISSGASHWMVFIDIDRDGVNGYVDWTNFEFNKANWRVPPTTSPTHTVPPPNFSPDYMGNSIFLKQHLPAWVLKDPRYNWENPFAFYDFDGDGCTEMSIRLLDQIPNRDPRDDNPDPQYEYTGHVYEAYSGIDLDNDSQKGNEFDFDMSFRFASELDGSNGGRIDYRHYRDKHPNMKAPQWVLDAGLFRYDNWRKLDEFIYVTHDRCFQEMWKTDWGSAWIVFDEDDDDHRWERVELYYPTDDVYSTSRWKSAHRGGGLPGHPQSDTLGDRGEWDADNSGKGQLYVGRWDGKLHLYGAESGAWTVDYGGKYWGSSPVLGNSFPDKAEKVEEIVQYRDTDGNGFFDEITYDYDGDKTIDLTISLLDYADEQNPHPDVADLLNPAELEWNGLHELYTKIARQSFQDASKVYRAAWKKGLTDPELDDLAIATSLGEQYDHGYWLKEKIFRKLDRLVEGADREQLRRAHFTGNADAVVQIIEQQSSTVSNPDYSRTSLR